MYSRAQVYRQYVPGMATPVIVGDGILDWVKGAAGKVWDFVKGIFAPTVEKASTSLLPALTAAAANGTLNLDTLKSAGLNFFKENAADTLARAGKEIVNRTEEYIPEKYRGYVKPMLEKGIDKATQLADEKIKAMEGDGLRKRRRKKQIDKLVSGAGIFRY